MAEKGDFMEGPSREEGGVCPDLGFVRGGRVCQSHVEGCRFM